MLTRSSALAAAAAVVMTAAVLVLPAAAQHDKQIRLEDIERDNLQTEQRVRHGPPQQQQQQQQPPQQQQQHHHQQPQQQPQQQQVLQYQQRAPQIMYLLMPGGQVAALQLAPHPNLIPAFYAGKPSHGTLYHQLHAATALQQYYQPHPQQMAIQYFQPAAVEQHQQHQPPAQQYYQPQPQYYRHQSYQPAQLTFSNPQAHNQHASHFSSLAAPQHELLFREDEALQQQPQHLQSQSPKSQLGVGAKSSAAAAAAAALGKAASYSTQTGHSYTNFRQYG